MQFIDTHCHIHDSEFFGAPGKPSIEEVLARAKQAGVSKMICVGTETKSSKQAISVAQKHDNLFCSLAIHPHEAANFSTAQLERQLAELESLAASEPKRLVAIGECGLDYFYHQDREVIERQKYLLRAQLELAKKFNLPVILHIREAFDDFFAIWQDFSELSGVVHSFSDNPKNLEGVVSRDLSVGLNGIMTFTKDSSQLEAAKKVPNDRLLLETDAPFLTPKPIRGKICEPKDIVLSAEFLSDLRGVSVQQLAQQSTQNAEKLFKI